MIIVTTFALDHYALIVRNRGIFVVGEKCGEVCSGYGIHKVTYNNAANPQARVSKTMSG